MLMEIKLKRFKSIYIMMLEGELDLYNAPRLEKLFISLSSKGVRSFLIDFSSVSYIDSSGVGTLLKLNSIARSGSLDLVLCSIEGEVMNVLKLTNLIQFFPSAENYREGIRKLLRESQHINHGAEVND